MAITPTTAAFQNPKGNDASDFGDFVSTKNEKLTSKRLSSPGMSTI